MASMLILPKDEGAKVPVCQTIVNGRVIHTRYVPTWLQLSESEKLLAIKLAADAGTLICTCVADPDAHCPVHGMNRDW